jgi:hypothetical protein
MYMVRRGLLVVITGCAGAEAMTLPPPSPLTASQIRTAELGLEPGESMAFDVKLAGVVAGEAQLAVGDIGEFEGHRVLVVKSRAQTVGAAAWIKKVIDEATTTIDLETGRPLALETLVEIGDRKVRATARFVGDRADVTYTRDEQDKPHTMRVDFGTALVHDAHSAMAQLRGWKAPPGTMQTVYVVGGRRLWRADVRYAGAVTIGSALGNRRAIRYDGASYRARPDLTVESDKPARTFSVWLSDDADRVPLRVTASTELGEIEIELTEYNRR